MTRSNSKEPLLDSPCSFWVQWSQPIFLGLLLSASVFGHHYTTVLEWITDGLKRPLWNSFCKFPVNSDLHPLNICQLPWPMSWKPMKVNRMLIKDLSKRTGQNPTENLLCSKKNHVSCTVKLQLSNKATSNQTCDWHLISCILLSWFTWCHLLQSKIPIRFWPL